MKKSVPQLVAFLFVCAVGPDILSAQTCQLFVEQPPNYPEATRAGGNTVWGQGRLRLTSPASGSWLVYLRAHLNFRPQGSGTWSEVNYSETYTSIQNGTATGFTYGSNLVQSSLQPRGNGDYQVTITSHGYCGGQDIQLVPQNPAPSAIVSVSRPTIRVPGDLQGIWWFGEIGKDDDANRYYSSAVIEGTPNWVGTLTYTISDGSTKVQLTCTNCNNTVVQAKAPSGGCIQDVTISASADGFSAAAPVKLCVNRPAGRYPDSLYSNSAALGGYWSKDYFRFTDLCALSMSSVAHHESFPGGIKYYWPGDVGSYWTGAPDANGWTAYRLDEWTTWDDIQRVCADEGCSPQTVPPSGYTLSRSGISSLMQQKIVALQQMWYVGDGTPGTTYGFLANQCNHTLYQDHAEDINYW